jgi:hypothetical protein
MLGSGGNSLQAMGYEDQQHQAGSHQKHNFYKWG